MRHIKSFTLVDEDLAKIEKAVIKRMSIRGIGYNFSQFIRDSALDAANKELEDVPCITPIPPTP